MSGAYFDVTLPLRTSPLLATMLGIETTLPANLQAYGNGVQDDTLAIQNAIYTAWISGQGGQAGGVVYFPAGEYMIGTVGDPGICPDLYLPGNVSLVGVGAGTNWPAESTTPYGGCPNPTYPNQNQPGAVLCLNAPAVSTAPPIGTTPASAIWINLGWAGPLDTVVVPAAGNQTMLNPCSLWSGRICGLRFTLNAAQVAFAPDLPTDYKCPGKYLGSQLNFYILYLHNCRGFAIENNFFDLEGYGTSVPTPDSISGTGYGGGAPANPTISHGIIRGNVITAGMGYYGSGGIQIGAATTEFPASHITIENNYISGVADEVIGVHTVNNAVVRNNFCSGVNAGILLTHCQHFLVEGNYIERCPAAPMSAWLIDGPTWWQGGLLFCGIEVMGRPRRPPTDGS